MKSQEQQQSTETPNFLTIPLKQTQKPQHSHSPSNLSNTSDQSKATTPLNMTKMNNENKVNMLTHVYSFPNQGHVQVSQISGGMQPCITCKHIMSFDLNPMTKEIFLITDRELAIFDIDSNHFKAVKTFKQILTYAIQSNPTLQGIGQLKLQDRDTFSSGGPSSSQMGSKPGTAAGSAYFNQIGKHQGFQKPYCLKLYNQWAVIKNSKQVLFLDSQLQFSKDTISDSNGIVDMVVSQRSEEIVTLTKDLRQIRVWTYMVYSKDRPMPPIDELPVNINSVDPNLHVFVTNKKNIHINLTIDQLCLNSICDILICSSSESNDLGIFTLKEGKNLYSIEYKTTDNSEGVELIKSKYSHDQGYFTKVSDSQYKHKFMLETHQEFLFIMNKRTQDLSIWDLALEQNTKTLSFTSICGPKAFIEFIYPSLCNLRSGFLAIDRQQNIYDISLHSQTVIQKTSNFRIQQQKHIQQQQSKSPEQMTFTSELKMKRRSSQNLSPFQMKDVKSGFTPRNKDSINDIQIFNLNGPLNNQPIKNPRTPKRQTLNHQNLTSAHFVKYITNQDGTKNLFMLREGDSTIEAYTLYSNMDVVMERKQPFNQILDPYQNQFVIKEKGYKNLLPIIDSNNSLNFLDIHDQHPKNLITLNLYELTQGYTKQMVEVPTLVEKHRPKRDLFNNPQNPKFFKYDPASRIGVFIDSQGLCCVINTHYRMRKFVFLEDRLKIMDVFIMVNHKDNNGVFQQLQDKILSDEEFNKKDNPYRYLENYPDFDFQIAVLTTDGIIIVVTNDSQFNDLRVSHRINMSTAILQARYIRSRAKLLVIIKEGIMKIFDVFKDMNIEKQCQLMWHDITAIDLRHDEIMIAGHDSGIIYTQNIKGEVKVTDMQLHNYHLCPIVQVALPLSEVPKKKFIALSANHVLTLFSMDQDRPLKVMRFADSIGRLLYLGKNEILVFNQTYLFKIDLNEAQPFKEQSKKLKEEWQSLIKQRIIRNNFTKKQVQVEEQRNDQFYQFQYHKQQHVKLQSSRHDDPEMFRFYMQLQSFHNIHHSLLQLEFDFLLSPDTSNFQCANFIFLEEIANLMPHYERTKNTVKSKKKVQKNVGLKQHQRQVLDQFDKDTAKNFLEQIEFQKKMRDMTKMTRQYKMSMIKSASQLTLTPQKVFRPLTKQAINMDLNLDMNSKEEQINTVTDRQSKMLEQRILTPQELKPSNMIIPEDSKITEEQDSNFLSQHPSQEYYKTSSQFSKFMKPKTTTKPQHIRGFSIQSKQSVGAFSSNVTSPKNMDGFDQMPPRKRILYLQQPIQYNLPTISKEDYTQELFSIKQKIQTLEQRAQTAAYLQIQNKAGLSHSQQTQSIFKGQNPQLQDLKYISAGTYSSILSNKPQTQASPTRKMLSQTATLQITQETQAGTTQAGTNSVPIQSENVSQVNFNIKSEKRDVHTAQKMLKPRMSSQVLNDKIKFNPPQKSTLRNHIATTSYMHKRQSLSKQQKTREVLQPSMDTLSQSQLSKMNYYNIQINDNVLNPNHELPWYKTYQNWSQAKSPQHQIFVEQVDTEDYPNVHGTQSKGTQNVSRNFSSDRLVKQPLQSSKFFIKLPDRFQSLTRFDQSQQAQSTQSKAIKVEENSPRKEQEKQYQNALKRFLIGDKSQTQQRINIMEKKAELVVQERPKKEDKGEGDAGKNDNAKVIDTLSESDESSGSNDFLGEEERSLIVDEILRANNEDDLVLEDDSPDKHEEIEGDNFGSVATRTDQGTQPSQDRQIREKNKFRLIIKSEKEQKIKAMAAAKAVQQYNLDLRKKPKIEDAFNEGILSAHKMRIVKHSKKEKSGAKYLLMKEIMREKVAIHKDDEGFQIIIPKTLKYGKANLHNIDSDEYVKNYNIYKLNMKDMVRLIRKQAMKNNPDGVVEGDTIITKEQVAAFLKKNLKKLLKEQDPTIIRKSKDLQEQLKKMESVKVRRQQREREKMLRNLQKEEDLLSKREKAKIERLLAQESKNTKKQIAEEQRKRIQQQQQSLFKVVHDVDSTGSFDKRMGTDSQGYSSKQSLAYQQQNDVQMVYATELKIAERREEIKRRLEMMKMEKEQERLRIERLQIYNFIKDTIVRGLIINRKVAKCIRDIEEPPVLPKKGLQPHKENYDGIQSTLNLQIQGQSTAQQRKDSSTTSLPGLMKGGKSRKSGLRVDKADDNSIELSGDDMKGGKPLKVGDKINKKGKKSRNNLSKNASGDPKQELLLIKEGSGSSRNNMMITPNQTKGQGLSRRGSMDIVKEDINDFIGYNKIKPGTKDQGYMDSLNFQNERSLSPRRSMLNQKQKTGGKSSRNRNASGNSPILSRNQPSQFDHSEIGEYEREDDDYEEVVSRGKLRQKSIYSTGGSGSMYTGSPRASVKAARGGQKKVQEQAREEEMSSEYYEEDPNDLQPPGQSVLGKSSSSRMHRSNAMKTPLRINLLGNDGKIKDYNLDASSQSSYHQSNTNFHVLVGPLSGGDPLSVLDSDADYMTKEEEIAKINQELQYQRILEKITEKMMSKKISQFKKELLIRIALNLEMMETADLFTLEELLEKYELHDPEVKQMIIALFQDKYHIDLGTDLQQMVEDQMNKVKDETKATRRKNIKQLLLKKIRMLNMISRFCKVSGPTSQDAFKNAQNAQKMLKDLLDEDDDEFYSDDEDGSLKQEFMETVQEVLKRIFEKDDQIVNKQLENFKRGYKMRFGAQPEYMIKDDQETENQNRQEILAAMRIQAFRFNEQRLLEVLQDWLHPQSLVNQTNLSQTKKKNHKLRKYLYDPNLELNEDNLSECFYDLVQEMMKRMKKVQGNIKANEKLLGQGRLKDGDGTTDDGSERVESTMTEEVGRNKKETIDLDQLYRRKLMSDLELEERQYCALRIAEHLETNMLHPENDNQDEDEPKKIYFENFLDPSKVHDRVIQRETISYMRQGKDTYKDPFIHLMAHAFRTYSKLLEKDQ